MVYTIRDSGDRVAGNGSKYESDGKWVSHSSSFLQCDERARSVFATFPNENSLVLYTNAIAILSDVSRIIFHTSETSMLLFSHYVVLIARSPGNSGIFMRIIWHLFYLGVWWTRRSEELLKRDTRTAERLRRRFTSVRVYTCKCVRIHREWRPARKLFFLFYRLLSACRVYSATTKHAVCRAHYARYTFHYSSLISR